ncbi:NADP-dependent oxidoreductase domain-containing protein [Scheffersomyces xylosifermentans]|uniref:NADP-dependent oxidoreductase domain-containing protein n=1 Tax=Scheffersomyces xylosifermentans TaxID=1304137 RepID=UPI00315DF374
MSNLTTSIQLTKQSKYKLNNGQYIPVAGYGVYLCSAEKTRQLVYQALKDGYRHIDSAVYYGNEKEAAQGIQEFLKDHKDVQRKDIFFTTKITNEAHGYDNCKKQIEEIAKDVKEHIDYVDLVLIHSPKTDKERRLGAWKALQEYVQNPNNGTLIIKSIGVSNYGIAHLEELFNWDGYLVKPVVNQLELHPWLPRLKLREYMVKHDILAEAYSPLTQGYKLNDPELLALEKSSGISKIEILLKWSYLQGYIVLAKTEKLERIAQNFNVLPDGQRDEELDETKSFGKVDLPLDVLEALDKPDSHEVLTWGNVDPTEYKDGDN